MILIASKVSHDLNLSFLAFAHLIALCQTFEHDFRFVSTPGGTPVYFLR